MIIIQWVEIKYMNIYIKGIDKYISGFNEIIIIQKMCDLQWISNNKINYRKDVVRRCYVLYGYRIKNATPKMFIESLANYQLIEIKKENEGKENDGT